MNGNYRIVGDCPFCTQGNPALRYVKKILRNGESEYICGVGKRCIITKLYQSVDETEGFKNKLEFF